MEPIATHFEVTDPVIGTAQVAAWIYPPQATSADLPAIWSLWFPGGTYSGRGYFDLHVAGEDEKSYSQARTLSSQGIGVITLDHLGTGQSPCTVHGRLLTRERYASLYALLVTHLRERLQAGTLCEQVATIPEEQLWLLGGGHSLGAFLLTALQARFHPFDAVALLGWTQGPCHPEWVRQMQELMQQGFSEHNWYVALDRRVLRPFFYGDPVVVTEDVIAADEAQAVSLPGGLQIPLEAHLRQTWGNEVLASQIACPVYLSFAEEDLTASASQEAQYYSGCRDVTCFILSGATHCANFALGRRQLWEHLAGWIKTQARLHVWPHAWVPTGMQ